MANRRVVGHLGADFRALPLRVHAFLHDCPLEDVWAMRLSGGGAGRTVEDLRAVFSAGVAAAPAIVKSLFGLRNRIGGRLGWDRERRQWNAESYVRRLTAEDRARSLAAPGTADGRFVLLYRFEDEQLSEIRNATVHGFLSLAIRPIPDGYVGYLAVYVRSVHPLTRLYMTAIAPFRRLVVYPAIIRKAQHAWAERYADRTVRAGAPPSRP